jgi:hypothetical protein
MDDEVIKREILSKIQNLASEASGKAPGIERFEAETGIKRHQWQGKLWRNWSDVVSDAGLSPNELRGPLSNEVILQNVLEIAKSIRRFPTTTDLRFELHQRGSSPNYKTVLSRWSMADLAKALAEYAQSIGEEEIAGFARSYVPPRRKTSVIETDDTSPATGYVYMQRHGADYKIGFTTSLNKRGRQIQIELPQETELVHSILTDDPVGVEAYWHKRFAAKRTRGEWFKLTKADLAAFKRWSKIW